MAAAGGANAAAASAAEPGLLTKLHTYVQISPQLGVLAERLGLKRLVPVAVDRWVWTFGGGPLTAWNCSQTAW
jgi:hypothetical protein